MKLADNLKKIRKENNLSQEQLAEKLGVSRQAVSKWESGQSYPEMDKVLLICKLFNYKMDELMNENIKDVNETKQFKNNINKYIEDFFIFITKTVDMFSSMKFKQKMKCIVEQLFVGLFRFLISLIVGAICSEILFGILGGLPYTIYGPIRSILQSIYIILATILGVTVLLHIFKIRYLDYYEIIKNDNLKDNTEDKEENQEQKKFIIKKNKEKIIIRDPEHSQSKFLVGTMKIVLCFIKFIAICMAVGFSISFIGLTTMLVLSFLFVKTGLVFFGAFIGITAVLIINYAILQILYNFIVSKKTHKTIIAILIFISLVLEGISIGMIMIGITNFKITQADNEIKDTYTFNMTDNLSFGGWYGELEYIETDSNDIKIEVVHSKYYNQICENENETIYLYFFNDNSKIIENIKEVIKDINNKEIKDYYNPQIYVYASQENIQKLRQNAESQYERLRQEEIDVLNNKNEQLEIEITELKEELSKGTLTENMN